MSNKTTITVCEKGNSTYNIIDTNIAVPDSILVIVNTQNTDSHILSSTFFFVFKENGEDNKTKNKERDISALRRMEVEEEGDEVFVENESAKQRLQKMVGYGKVDIEEWSSEQFMKMIKDKFKKAYGTNAFEFGNSDSLPPAKGRIYSKIKNNLIGAFEGMGLKKTDLCSYIEWAYGMKAKQISFPITLSFLCSKDLMTEWMVVVKKSYKQNTQYSNLRNGK